MIAAECYGDAARGEQRDTLACFVRRPSDMQRDDAVLECDRFGGERGTGDRPVLQRLEQGA